LVEATQEVGNNKEPDDAKRRYILAIENPVEVAASVLTLRFEFRVPTQADKDRAAAGAVAVFGGDYARASNPKKGDEREQFCADAEKRAVAAMPEAWKTLIAAPGAAATPDKPARTLLGKHLDHFTARNTFDYFIHKDLGGFLRRELDFYIKNEVVRLDDLESLPPDHLQRVQGKVKAIRRVAGRIIDFLAAIENFQKKMWLKKKFVLNTNWLVTVDRIPPALRDVVAQNAEQWAEWERLGFKPENIGDAGLFGGAAWGTRAHLDACSCLPVDTRHFSRSFVAELLSTEAVLNRSAGLDSATTGLLVNSENLQALGMLHNRFSGQVHTIYIDPPYNTAASAIAYKNEYKESSWLSLIADRVQLGKRLLTLDGIVCVAIDDVEAARMRCLFDGQFGPASLLGVVAVRSNPAGRSTPKGFAEAHEYAVFLAASDRSVVGRLRRNEEQRARYSESDNKGAFEWVNFRKHGGREATREARPKMYYPIYAKNGLVRLPKLEWNAKNKEWNVLESPMSGEEVVWPINEAGDQLRWKWGSESFVEDLSNFCAKPDQRGRTGIYLKSRMTDEGMLPVTWWDSKEYSATEYGTNLLKRMFGRIADFTFPKALRLVVDCIRATNVDRDSWVCDFFGGSGTTAHAVIQLNREDGGGRRFILVEMGKYFDSVLLPRVAKALFSAEWREGRAQSWCAGTSSLIKYLSLESYEDALNNLPAPSGTLLEGRSAAEKDALITYGLDLELGPHLLNLDAFRDPWGYTINAQLAGDAEIKRHRVDLVETFNYLIGLKVHAHGPLEHFDPEFERVRHDDGLGKLKVKTWRGEKLVASKTGPHVFQRVEGELNPASNGGNAARVLVVWRKLTDDPEKDAAVLDAWMARHRENTRERTEHRDYHLIYINGPVTLPQPTAEIRTVYPTEETFKAKMFEDTDSASATGGANG